MTNHQKTSRQPFKLRFTLRALMLLVSAACLWVAWQAHQEQTQRQLIAWVHGHGGDVAFDWQLDADDKDTSRPKPPGPQWLRKLIGPEYFQRVAEVNLSRSRVDDPDLAMLSSHYDLRRLSLDGTAIGDAGLAHLSRLGRLEHLRLSSTKVTDSGLEHVRRMPRLRFLSLEQTSIGNAGLVHVRRLSELEVLLVNHTGVSDDGLAALSELHNLEVLGLGHTRVRGSGLQHLPGQRLKKLWLDGSLLDDEGARYLARFDRLECLYVDKTEVTAAGIAHFRWLPNLEIVRGTASRFVPLKRLIAQEHVRAGVTIDAADRLKVQVRY